MIPIHRRAFLAGTAAGVLGSMERQAGAADSAPAPGGRGRWPKAILDSLLPPSMPLEDQFRLAVDLGYEGLEAAAPEQDREAEAIGTAARRAGLRIHSVMNRAGNWAFPLSSGDPQIAEQGLRHLTRALKVAAQWGADCVLLVPAQVTPEVPYEQAWPRSQQAIRRVLPLAGELGVSIAIENVGNRFLLSPLEFTRYVDEFADPRLRAYFDVGNSLMLWGYPQQWLQSLGRRICKIHLKDCKFAEKRFVPLGDGDVDWAAVRQAMTDVGYQGYVTVEPNHRLESPDKGGREALADLARRMDNVLRAG